MSNAQSAGSAKPKFKPGDKVIRINCDNPQAARIGQVATVVNVKVSSLMSMVDVVYDGCRPNGRDNEFPHAEGWYADNTQLYVEPKDPIEWENSEFASEGYVDGFAFANIRRPWGPCGRIRYPYWVLKTQLPYDGWSTVGQFKTLEAAKKYAEDEANDLKILGKFKGGLK